MSLKNTVVAFTLITCFYMYYRSNYFICEGNNLIGEDKFYFQAFVINEMKKKVNYLQGIANLDDLKNYESETKEKYFSIKYKTSYIGRSKILMNMRIFGIYYEVDLDVCGNIIHNRSLKSH